MHAHSLRKLGEACYQRTSHTRITGWRGVQTQYAIQATETGENNHTTVKFVSRADQAMARPPSRSNCQSLRKPHAAHQHKQNTHISRTTAKSMCSLTVPTRGWEREARWGQVAIVIHSTFLHSDAALIAAPPRTSCRVSTLPPVQQPRLTCARPHMHWAAMHMDAYYIAAALRFSIPASSEQHITLGAMGKYHETASSTQQRASLTATICHGHLCKRHISLGQRAAAGVCPAAQPHAQAAAARGQAQSARVTANTPHRSRQLTHPSWHH